jgi:hypothetical protein
MSASSPLADFPKATVDHPYGDVIVFSPPVGIRTWNRQELGVTANRASFLRYLDPNLDPAFAPSVVSGLLALLGGFCSPAQPRPSPSVS